MNFDVLGPYFLKTKSVIKISHVDDLVSEISADATASTLLQAPGCYVFGIKSSGAPRVMPWYVGKAERQAVLKEATNAAHLQVYNEILDEYERGDPALFFIPSTTPTGRPSAVATGPGRKPAVEFLENWLIAKALKANANLWNVKKTKMLRDLYVRGIFNPTKGDWTTAVGDLKKTLGM